MAQNNNVAAPVQRYTRADFTALRAKLNRIPVETIIGLYYNEDDLIERGCETPQALSAWLDAMRDHLVKRASLANPQVAASLADARSANVWSKRVVDFLVASADRDTSQPRLDDPLSAWFKPRVAKALAAEGLTTLGALKAYMERRGHGWYRPIPRLGTGKARTLERWFDGHATLGRLAMPVEAAPAGQLLLGAGDGTPVPLERIRAIAVELDGRQGANRGGSFCLIAAGNDLEAVQAYLYRFRDRPKTCRAYQKELERFLLWCVLERRIALSSVLTAECEAYKDFLAGPPAAWCGVRAPRRSSRWRPFAGALQPESQRYAVQVIRTFFEWLVRVRYLGGNPWITVSDPMVQAKALPIAIDKALPGELWDILAGVGGLLDRVCGLPPQACGTGEPISPRHPEAQRVQYRLARAALLLIGTTGIRREEAAFATRDRLKPLLESVREGIPALWELEVLGKRRKWRSVFMPARVVEALRAHWIDRGADFDGVGPECALLSPVIIPDTPTSRTKHVTANGDSALTGYGFSADGLYRLVKATLSRLADDLATELSTEERTLIRRAAPHALRHTFATVSAAREMPQDVLQRLLGHASMQTTSIYVQAERKRSIAEVRKVFLDGAG